MTLADSLREYIAAAFTGLWIESHEHDDALAEIAQLCRQERWRLAIWDLEQGLQVAGRSSQRGWPCRQRSAGRHPLVQRPGRRRQLGDPGAGQLPPLPAIGRDRAGPGQADGRRQAEPHVRRDPVAGGADPVGAGKAVRRHRARRCPAASSWSRSPAASRPKTASCPRASSCSGCWMPPPA